MTTSEYDDRSTIRTAVWPRPVPLGRAGTFGIGAAGDFAVRRLLPWVLPLVLLALWQAVTALGWLAPQILPSPAQTFQTFIDLVRDGSIADNIAISAPRILIGLVIGTAAGLVFGVLIGVSRSAEAYFGPTFRAVAAIPSLGWLPILILIFGLDETLKYVIIAKACFVPVTINTAEGIRNIPVTFKEVGRVLRLRRSTWLTRLVLPAALPSIATGLRQAVSSAWISLIVVELLSATEGVGYMMSWGRTLFQMDIVLIGMALIGVIGLAMDAGLGFVERRIRRWSPGHV